MGKIENFWYKWVAQDWYEIQMSGVCSKIVDGFCNKVFLKELIDRARKDGARISTDKKEMKYKKSKHK